MKRGGIRGRATFVSNCANDSDDTLNPYPTPGNHKGKKQMIREKKMKKRNCWQIWARAKEEAGKVEGKERKRREEKNDDNDDNDDDDDDDEKEVIVE